MLDVGLLGGLKTIASITKTASPGEEEAVLYVLFKG